MKHIEVDCPRCNAKIIQALGCECSSPEFDSSIAGGDGTENEATADVLVVQSADRIQVVHEMLQVMKTVKTTQVGKGIALLIAEDLDAVANQLRCVARDTATPYDMESHSAD